MGRFDDLIPSSSVSEKPKGRFDDLIPGTAKQEAGPVPATEKPSLISEAISNIPSSGVRYGKDVVGGVKAIGGLIARGAGEDETDIDGKQILNSIIEHYKGRYGGREKLEETIRKDPVGFLGDLSTFLSAGGGAVKLAGKAGKISSLAKAGGVVAKAGEAVEPLSIAGKGAQALVTGAGKTVAGLSGLSTGTYGEPFEVYKQAKKGGEAHAEAIGAMRGKISGENIVEDAKQALETVREKRSVEYRKGLEKVKGDAKTFDFAVNSIKNDLNKRLKVFGVEVLEDGTLDFSRANVSNAGQGSIQEAVDIISSWGTKERDYSAIGLDTLKRKLNDIIPETGAARAFITPLKNDVRKTLIKNVPGYEKMVRGYEELSNFLKETQKTFSLTDRASVDTSLRKLTQTYRHNFENRKELLKALDDISGKQLSAQIAGHQMQPFLPRGLARFTAGGGAAAAIATNPTWLLGLAAASPRVVGEFLNVLGVSQRTVGKMLNTIYKPQAAQSLFQTGKISRESK